MLSYVKMSDKKNIIEERKEKILSFFRYKKEYVYYVILGVIVFISFYIRTRNVPRLKDITTGSWTLGPDLDPFLFLRWAKYIVENGSLMVIDHMRYVPLGYDTAGEMKLLAYMIAWFYHILAFFSKEVTVTYAAILFPAVMAVLTGVAFFLFARKIFYKEDEKTKNIIALIATAFFVLIPSLLPRTIAGIPEKESAAFFFMFMAFYLFLEAFTSETFKKRVIFGTLSGIFTALMALIWGGVIYVFFTLSTATLLAFILGKVDKEKIVAYGFWVATSFLIMNLFSSRYTLKNLISSTSTGFTISVFLLIVMSFIFMNVKRVDSLRKRYNFPKEIFSLILSIGVLIVIVNTVFGTGFIVSHITDTVNTLVFPQKTRFGLTVAENKQPYFINDWKNSFGPVFKNIPLYFWLFFSGSVVLFANMIRNLKKDEKMILVSGYIVFLVSLVFSRYSASSILDGVSGLSLTVYFGGWLFFIGSFGYVYYKKYRENTLSDLRKISFAYVMYFIVMTLGIIGARSGIRLVMVLGAITPVAVSFLIVKSYKKFVEEKEDSMKILIGVILVIVALSSILTLWSYYKSDIYTAENFAPGPYQWQWQKAMAWVRENTSETAVFAHWWDYGYWVQSIGNRATILDGGNAIGYWNHLMGRYVLTGPDEMKALEFLYTHNGTHLLIDSTDIGKYTAFSSIGADENYDRFSWIPTFLMNERQTRETKNETIYVYTGGTLADEDIVWYDNKNRKEIFLPRKKAGIAAIIIKQQLVKAENSNASNNSFIEISQPEAVFVYNGKQYNIPLKYLYYNNYLYNFSTGIEAGVFLFPKLNTLPDGRMNLNSIGAAFYLSPRTVHSQLVKLYLFNKQSKYFKLVHTEDSIIIERLKEQGVDIGSFVYYNGFQGPIKIWEINYPENMTINPQWLSKEFPSEKLYRIKPGEY